MGYVVGPDDGFEMREIHALKVVEEIHKEVDHDFQKVHSLEGGHVGFHFLIMVHHLDRSFINNP